MVYVLLTWPISCDTCGALIDMDSWALSYPGKSKSALSAILEIKLNVLNRIDRQYRQKHHDAGNNNVIILETWSQIEKQIQILWSKSFPTEEVNFWRSVGVDGVCLCKLKSLFFLSPPLQVVLQVCVPVGVYAVTTAVPTDPPAQGALVQAPTMPCVPLEWASLPLALSWLFGLWYLEGIRVPLQNHQATPQDLITTVVVIIQEPQRPQQWPWCLLELGHWCWS